MGEEQGTGGGSRNKVSTGLKRNNGLVQAAVVEGLAGCRSSS